CSGPREGIVPTSPTLADTTHVVGVDLTSRSLTVAGPDGQRRELTWHRLVLTPGGVSSTLPLSGMLEQAKGFHNIAEAPYLRDHVLGQMELADASDDPAQRQARCTFVVAGAGTTGTEVAAQGQLFTRAALRRYPRIRPDELRWLLVDRAMVLCSPLPEPVDHLALQAFTPAMSMASNRARTPNDPASCAWSAISAACSSALAGM